MKIICASENPVKVEVAKQAFAAVFPNEEIKVVGVKTHSGVPDQPFDDETLRGAENRLQEIRTHHPDADYWIAQEGGLYNEGHKMFNRAWIVVCDKNGIVGKSSTASFYLPTKVAELVRKGNESGIAYDKFFETENIKQKGGGLARLTNGLLTRTSCYLESAIIAICEVLHKEWYE